MTNIITPFQAIEKAKKFCAYQERSQEEVRRKLREWGQEPEHCEAIIIELIDGNFLNELRFCCAYVRGKFRIKKWGRVRIRQGLKLHRVSEPCIKKALCEIDGEEYYNVLTSHAEKKLQLLQKKKSNKNLLRPQLAGFLVSKGFEQDLVMDVIQKLMSK